MDVITLAITKTFTIQTGSSNRLNKVELLDDLTAKVVEKVDRTLKRHILGARSHLLCKLSNP